VYYRWRTSGFDWRKFLAALEGLDWSWMVLALALVLATYVGRTLRWEVMLRPMAPEARLGRILVATIIGFTAVVLFGRAGEPVRPYLIARKENVSFSSQLAAWVLERLLDMLMVLVIFGVALSQVSHSNIALSPRINGILEAGGYAAGVTGLICIALLIAMRQFRGRVRERLTGALEFLPRPLHIRVDAFLAAFEEGMRAIRSGAFVSMLLAYTAIEWAVIAGAFYCVFRAFPATAYFQPNDVVIVLGFVAFGSILQIPGVGGGMQIATALVLTEFYGLTLEAASGIALVLWIVNFVSIVPVGLVLAFREGLEWSNLRHITTSAEETTADEAKS